jgi:hypothetical protein
MNYQKWDQLDDEELDEEDHFQDTRESPAAAAADVEIKRLYDIKYSADHLFSLFKYEQSLSMYHQLSLELKQLLQQSDDAEDGCCLAVQELFVLCHLNLACCYLKISEWLQCISTCDIMLTGIHNFSSLALTFGNATSATSQAFSPEKHTRCLYFKAFSLYELSRQNKNQSSNNSDGDSGGDSGALDLALHCCREIQNIISHTNHFADQSLVSEIDPLISRIQKQKEENSVTAETISSTPSATAILPLTSVPSTIAAAAVTEATSRDIATLLHESQRCIAMNQPSAAIKTLKKCISVIRRRGAEENESVTDPRIVVCFQRMGDCFKKLQEYDEVLVFYHITFSVCIHALTHSPTD